MLKKLKLMILSISYILTLSLAGGASAMLPAKALALDCNNPQTIAEREDCGACQTDPNNCPGDPGQTVGDTIRRIINVISVLAGAVAVVMIIVGGFRYVTSAGNPETVKNARNTIIYALVGLIVIAFAQVIVHFTLTSVS